MDRPLVTVLVVSFNQSKYIRENLDSIRDQSYSNIELIVADDASTDNSVVVFEKWLQENQINAKTNFHILNTGLSTVLNECIAMANGKYIKLIAADDFLHADYISSCVKLFENAAADIIYTKAYGVDDTSQIVSEDFFGSPEYKNDEELKALLYKGNFISGASIMLKKSVYSTIGDYKKDVLLEDYDLVLNALNNNLTITYLPQNLLYYRRHDSNISKTKFNLLQAHTILTKIEHDINFEFDSIINSDLLKQLKLINPNLVVVKKSYGKYKKKKLLYLFLINKPLFIKLLIKMRLL